MVMLVSKIIFPVRYFFLNLFLFILMASDTYADGRGKVITFDDTLVEGMGKKPFDSLTQLSESERRKRKRHLYQKRAGYTTENDLTMRELAITEVNP